MPICECGNSYFVASNRVWTHYCLFAHNFVDAPGPAIPKGEVE